MTKVSDLGYPENVLLSLKMSLVPQKMYLKRYPKKHTSGISKMSPPVPQKLSTCYPKKCPPFRHIMIAITGRHEGVTQSFR